MRARREIEITNLLQRHGTVDVKELMSTLGVSRNTVRRDLQSLERQGVLHTTRGGAVLNEDAAARSSRGPTEERVAFFAEKRRIGEAANGLVSDGSSIILDSGTTTDQIAVVLRERSGLTVITNSMKIAGRFGDTPHIATVLAGGLLNTMTHTFTGDFTEQFLQQFHVDLAFISAGGITADAITNAYTVAGKIKKIMIDAAEKSYLVVTHDKIGKRSLASFARPEDVTGIITDGMSDSGLLERFKESGLEVIVC